MKKLIALLTALMLLCAATACFAETADSEPVVTVSNEQILNFNITMDEIPAGYNYEKIAAGNAMYFYLSGPDDEMVYMGSVAFSEDFDGYTLDLASLTAEETAQMETMMAAGYNAPSFTTDKTSHGTDVIIINENGAESDYMEIVTIYQGYFITIGMLKQGELTEEDLATGLKIMSDLWIVPAN